ISSMVRKDELSTEIIQNAESVVTAINSTDGVGKVKSVKVTVDDNGLTVDDGAVIIRDSQNTAIITSQGLKVMFVYTSSGELNGWQKIGYQVQSGHPTQANAYITFIVPEKLQLTNAELVVHSLPSRWEGWSDHFGVPDGVYHARNMRLFKVSDGSNSVYDYPAQSTPAVLMGITGRTDITNDVWGGQWTPSGINIQEKTGNVTNHIETGKYQTFGVASIDNLNTTNMRYMGGLKFTLVVEGYLRG
ncbi:MAG TPA: hypothetical protein VK031_05850, partial [Tissierellaceae bacterium]|nr:hypothetical protein [Tissierellaceae bacterium]